MNPYTSSGSVATMTANVSGNDSLNDLGDGPRQPGDPERYPVGAVTRRLLGYVRPHRVSFAASFLSAAVSVILQLYTQGPRRADRLARGERSGEARGRQPSNSG